MKAALTELAHWAVELDTIPARARHAARRVLMDQVGVSLAGGKQLDTLSTGRPSATVWSSGERRYAPDAALANRFAGDDLELTAGPEVGAAGVAAAELAGATLGALYVAIAVAGELEQYVRGWLQSAVERHGLHPPAVFGAFSAAAVATKLLRLDVDRFTGALGAALALAPQSPYVSFSRGATGKWLYGAWSQRLGVQSALWAHAGVVGADTTLEGSRGIAQAFLHRREPALPFRPPESTEGWAITRVTHKAFPCSRACHPALTALEKLAHIDGNDIERAEVWSYPFSVELEKRSAKNNPIASQMSVSRIVSAALGGKVPVVVHSEGSETLPPAQRVRKARVRLTLKDGSVREEAAGAKWDASAPATDDELRHRFLEMTEGKKCFDPWKAGEDTRVVELLRGG